MLPIPMCPLLRLAAQALNESSGSHYKWPKWSADSCHDKINGGKSVFPLIEVETTKGAQKCDNRY